MKKIIIGLIMCLLSGIALASLIDNPAPVTPTKHDVSYWHTKILQNNTQIYQTIRQYHTSSYNTIWHNPDSYTPQEIINTFSGSDQYALFQLSEQIQQLLKAVNPSYVILDPTGQWNITVSADGIVTLTPKQATGTATATGTGT